MKTNIFYFVSRLTSLLLLFIFSVPPEKVIAQLAGEYTIGGQNPDFQHFADAINAMNSQGISSSVIFNIRQGEYEPLVNSDPVINIEQNIQGADENNRITFRPDAFSGANVDNVTLTRKSGSLTVGYRGIIANIAACYITFKNLTLKNEDITTADNLMQMIKIGVPSNGTESRLVQVSGCKIYGNSGTCRALVGVGIEGTNYGITIKDNKLIGSINGVRHNINASYSMLIENNYINDTWLYGQGGNNAGSGIDLNNAAGFLIKNNIIDYSNGSRGVNGIAVGGTNFRIEGNLIKNIGGGMGGDYDSFWGIYISPSASDGVIANNMIGGLWTERRYGIYSYGNNLKIYHNTIVLPDRGFFISNAGQSPFTLIGSNNRVINNIFIELANVEFTKTMIINDTATNFFDYNVLFNGGNYLVVANSTIYASLEDWQNAGHDLNSISKLPEFFNDFHLFDCSSADEELWGIFLPEVTTDFDGELRHTVHPFMGADEGLAELPGIFGNPQDFFSGDQSWSFTPKDLDLDGADDLIVTNTIYNNGSNDVTILWNDGNSNFTSPQHLRFGDNPNIVKAGFINSDNVPDLVVVNYDSVMVRFGLGSRTFSVPVLISGGETQNLGDMQLTDYDNDGDTDVLALYSPSTDTGFVVIFINDGNGTFTWLNSAYAGKHLDQLQINDFDNDTFLDLVIVDNGNNSLYTLKNLGTISPGVSKGFDDPVEYNALVYSFPSESKFVTGDFDNDSDNDIVAGRVGNPDSLVMMRNNGNGMFERETFQSHPTRTPRVIDAFDYEGDGDLDIVTANFSKDMHLLLNDGSGNFERALVCSQGNLPAVPQAILTAKLDNDNIPDVAVLGAANDTVTIFKNLRWIPTSINDEVIASLPEKFELFINYPNPFNPVTTISYSLTAEAFIELKVYDILGREIATLVNEEKPAGYHKINFDASQLASGMYLYRLQAGSFNQVRKMILIR